MNSYIPKRYIILKAPYVFKECTHYSLSHWVLRFLQGLEDNCGSSGKGQTKRLQCAGKACRVQAKGHEPDFACPSILCKQALG